MATSPRKPRSWIVRILILAGVVFGAYFANVALQTHWGEQALEATGLTVHTFAEASALAATSNKPILADHAAIWCPSCRRFDDLVLSDPGVRAVIEEHYIFARVEYESDEGAVFRERYSVRGFPQLLVINADGTLRARLSTSPTTPEAFLAQIRVH